MNTKFEKIGNNKGKLTVEVDKDTFSKSEQKVYNKRKKNISLPGFRKGHATLDMIYKAYGRGVFFEDAANDCINATYPEAIKSVEKRILSKPEVDVEKIGIDDDFVYTATFAIVPDFTVAKYKNVEIKKTKVAITDDDVKAKLLVEQEKNASLVTVDREIKNGDIANIDFEGFIDNVPFKGGKGENYPLTIGTHSFIDNFEDQLIGHKVGENVDVKVKFPDDYMEKSLQGKEALFKVKINEVKEKVLPEIDDEFVSEISEFEKLEDYKKDLKNKLIEEGEKKAKAADKQKIIDEIVKNTEIDLAKEAIEASIDDIVDNITRNLYYQKVSMDDYLKMTGQTMESLRDGQREAATTNLKTSLILDEIGKLENIKAPDDKVEEYIENMAKSYGLPVDKFKERYITEEERENIVKDLLYPTVVDFLYDNAKLKEG